VSVGTHPDDVALEDLRTALLVGAVPPPPDRLPGRAARALEVARAAGAPTLPAVEAASAARDDELRRRRAVQVATAQARAVTVALGAMPLLAVPALGALLDLPLAAFYTSPLGLGVGLAGLALVAVGTSVSLALVRRAAAARPTGGGAVAAIGAGVALGLATRPLAGVVAAAASWWWQRRRSQAEPPNPAAGTDEVVDLLATAVSGGLPGGAAMRTVADAFPDLAGELRAGALAVELGAPVELPPGLDRAARILVASVRTGAPAAPALRRTAADLRAAELADALSAAERLPALLAFPTALCLMPACVLLVGAPLLAVGLSAATSGT
jgi:Flp pilus assembly protein TadB